MPDFENQFDHRVPFEAATDAMAIVDVSSDDWRIRTVNGAFTDAFDCPASAVHDEPLGAVLGFDPVERVGAHPRRERETRAELGVTGDEYLVRVRPFDQPIDSAHALVVVSDASTVGASATAGNELIHTLAEVAGADDASAVCVGVAALLLDDFGFDAVVIHVDEGVHLTNVDESITFDSAEPTLSIRHEVHDPRNDETWGTVVQAPVGDRGVVVAATCTSHALDSAAIERLESLCRYLDLVLDGIERTRSLRAEQQELTMFNRILRHSVLNGLNLIRARLELVETDGSETSREHYETANARIDDLLDRIEAIREIQVEDGTAEVGPYRLEVLLDERLTRASEKYPDASFSVVGSIPEATIEVGDLVHVCLRNVLRNAVQHADLGSPEVRVRVTIDETADVATVRIADNGSGFPDDIDRSIFDEGVSRFDGEGHGLGLFLTRKVVEDGYGGTVRAGESDCGGAEIVLEFPLADPPDSTPD
ncbi:sensor histidine kinase [Haloplanus aerogenes]|uniref:histidine kinase n=1 Tax=Haloplanus aerogenes TaxID=660522 RepID=A0A3M0DA27_9EURY|nr:HAMP domain-containing sensor histidine kinase [Haloplanus aerogenes]AZH26079.1 sensor histidine kinase [Haloplanus aerogenes]RMB18472.1 histidine kinase/DNA gyrase B/HSP90-like ATPase [Haloplanus aerogenes]